MFTAARAPFPQKKVQWSGNGRGAGEELRRGGAISPETHDGEGDRRSIPVATAANSRRRFCSPLFLFFLFFRVGSTRSPSRDRRWPRRYRVRVCVRKNSLYGIRTGEFKRVAVSSSRFRRKAWYAEALFSFNEILIGVIRSLGRRRKQGK